MSAAVPMEELLLPDHQKEMDLQDLYGIRSGSRRTDGDIF